MTYFIIQIFLLFLSLFLLFVVIKTISVVVTTQSRFFSCHQLTIERDNERHIIMARHSKAKRQALKTRQIISHNVTSLMGKFESMSHRGYVCQNLAKPQDMPTTWQERQRIRQAHAR